MKRNTWKVKRVKDRRYKNNYRVEVTNRITKQKYNTRWSRTNTLKKNKEIVRILNKKDREPPPSETWYKGEMEKSWTYNKRTTKSTFSEVGAKLGHIRIITYSRDYGELRKEKLTEAIMILQDILLPSVKFGEKFLSDEYTGYEIRECEKQEVEIMAIWGTVRYDIVIKGINYAGTYQVA